MEKSPNSEVPKEIPREDEASILVPEEWKDYNFPELAADGWKPRVKKTKGRPYISLYKGNTDRGLGLYDEERWNLLTSMFPPKVPKTFPHFIPRSKDAKFPLSLIGTTMKRADWVPKTFTPTVDTLKWFETLKVTGSPVGFDEFINDIVETHFTQCHGLKFRIVMTQP